MPPEKENVVLHLECPRIWIDQAQAIAEKLLVAEVGERSVRIDRRAEMVRIMGSLPDHVKQVITVLVSEDGFEDLDSGKCEILITAREESGDLKKTLASVNLVNDDVPLVKTPASIGPWAWVQRAMTLLPAWLNGPTSDAREIERTSKGLPKQDKAPLQLYAYTRASARTYDKVASFLKFAKDTPQELFPDMPPTNRDAWFNEYLHLTSGANKQSLQFLFPYGGSIVTDKKQKIEVVARCLKQLSNQPDIIIIGFADSDGTDYENQKISQARADAVRDELKRNGITNKIISRGFADNLPVEKTRGRSDKNRRVELWLK